MCVRFRSLEHSGISKVHPRPFMNVDVAIRYSTLHISKQPNGADGEVSQEVPEVIGQEMNLYVQRLGRTKAQIT